MMNQSSPRDTSQLHSSSLRGWLQLGLPSQLTPEEIARERTLGGSIDLCAKAAGFDLDKELQQRLKVDKAQFSRWLSGQEGIVWPKLEELMDVCGNDVPVLWMFHRRGYDLHAIRKRETELQAALRKANERIAELEREREITMNVLRDVRA